MQRLVDIEQKMAEGKGRGYERWATMHNLKQMAATLNVYQEYGFTSPEQLEAPLIPPIKEMRQTSGELKALETKLQGKKGVNSDRYLPYAKTKPARDGLRAQKSEKARAAHRQAYESDFIIAEAAARYFKAHGHYQAARPESVAGRDRAAYLREKTACITPTTNRNSGSRSCRPSSGTSTRFCAGRNPTAERSRAMSDKLPRMDYRQHRRGAAAGA